MKLFSFPHYERSLLIGDWQAGWASAIIMLPQAVVLAALAGLPPEMGIYASVFPVVVAALLGAAPRLLSGPNTAVAVMLGAALTPLATPASTDYVQLALTLTAMVGMVQLLAAGARLGQLFDALPNFIIYGVTLGVGLVIILTQLPTMLGVLNVTGEAPWRALWYALDAWPHTNLFALSVTLVSVSAGFIVSYYRLCKFPPLVAALVAGTLLTFALDGVYGSAVVNLERVGHLNLHLLPLSYPTFSSDALYVLKQLLQSALGIALIGALQTNIIARSVACGAQETAHPNRELFAQGMVNLVGSFTNSFAGSGSFNRSAAHVRAGARTPLAAVLSAIILFALVFAAEPVLALIPSAAMAGTLILVGWGLLASTLKQCLSQCSGPSTSQRRWTAAFPSLLVGFMVAAAGLETAVFWACAVGLFILVWRYAQSQAQTQAQTANDIVSNTPSPTLRSSQQQERKLTS